MSELVGEALPVYQGERQTWQDVFAHSETNVQRLGVNSQQDAVRMLREHRQHKRNTTDTNHKTGTKRRLPDLCTSDILTRREHTAVAGSRTRSHTPMRLLIYRPSES